MTEDEWQEEGSFLQKIKESPRTVSALIIILIVAAAIYAFSGEKAKDETGTLGPEGITQTEATGGAGGGEGAVAKEAANEAASNTEKPGKVAAEMTTSSENIEAQAPEQPLPQPERTAEGYKEVAQAGEGITHLARRATTKWLSENQVGYTVTDEHRIYIEDYIQNRVGSERLRLGETRTISFDLIAEATAAAEQLSEQQLQNLSQYTYVLN